MIDTISLSDLIATMNRLREELGPQPPVVRVSPHATAMPKAEPRSDYMREYVNRVGRSPVPAAFRFKECDLIFGGSDRDMLVVHPDLISKETQNDRT